MKRLNVKLLAALVVFSLVLGVGTIGLHRFQVGRTSGFLKAEADEAHQEGLQAREAGDQVAAAEKLKEASGLYRIYVHYRPQDADAMAAYALAQTDFAESAAGDMRELSRAIGALDEAVRKDAAQEAARRRLVELYMKYRDYTQAQEHLEMLVAAHPEDVGLRVQQAQAYLERQETTKATTLLDEAIAEDPSQIEAYELLVRAVGTGVTERQRTDALMDDMVAANADRHEAYIARARYRHRAADLEGAQADIQKALEFEEVMSEADSILSCAEVLIASKNYNEARRLLARAIESFPKDERVYRGMYALAIAENDREAAIETLEQGLERIPDSLNLLVFITDQYLQAGRLDDVKTKIKEIEETPNHRPEIVQYLQAYVSFSEGDWLDAARLFNTVRPLMPALAAQIDLRLGQCYRLLGRPGDAVVVYERLLLDDPTSVGGRLGYAGALLAAGQQDRAFDEYNRLKDAIGLDEFVKLYEARNNFVPLLTARLMRAEQSNQNTSELEALLKAINDQAAPDSVDPLLLRVQTLAQQGQVEQAISMTREYLAVDRPASSDEARVWLALSRLVLADTGVDAALAVLDEAAAKVGDAASLRIARAAYVAQRGGDGAVDELKALTAGAESLTSDEQYSLYSALGQSFYQLQALNEARTYWTKAVDIKPEDPRLQKTLFELARQQGDEALMDKAIDDIKAHLGADSVYVDYAEAARLFTRYQTDKANSQHLANSLQFLAKAEQKQSNWFEVDRLRGDVHIARGDVDAAIESYKAAMNNGEQSASVLQRLAELLYRRGRLDEADVPLRRLSQLGGEAAAYAQGRLAVVQAQNEGNFEQLVELAQQAVDEDPENPTKLLYLGEIQARADRPEEAEQTLRRAVEFADAAPQAWVPLVKHLVRTQKTAEARDVVAEARTKLAPEFAPVVLAQCYELLQAYEQAEQNFVAAAAAEPDDVGLKHALATFYFRAAVRDASTGRGEEHLAAGQEQVDAILNEANSADASSGAHLAWARRAKAEILGRSGIYKDFRAALDLLDKNRVQGELPVDDMVVQASLWAQRPEKSSREQAIRMFRELSDRGTLTAPGRFALAQLYERVGNWEDGRSIMIELLIQDPENAQYLVEFVQMLIRNGEVSQARPYVDRLKRRYGTAPFVVGVEARVLIAQDQGDEAVKIVRGILPPPPIPADKLYMLRDVARLLQQLKQYAAAEQAYREFVAATNHPVANLMFAQFLGAHGSLDECLDECQRALTRNTPANRVLQIALAAVRDQAKNAEQKHYDRIGVWFDRGLAAQPNDLSMRLLKAEYFDLQGKYDEAERTYRELLADANVNEQQRAVVENNLAFMLALRSTAGGASPGSASDALRMIENAIAVLGPSADLLDTRAMVKLAQNDVKGAIADLEQSIQESPNGPKYFHLALAHNQARDTQRAAAALAMAHDEYDLDVAQVGALEREQYQDLVNRLGVN